MVGAVLCQVARLKPLARLCLVCLLAAIGLSCTSNTLEDDVAQYQSRMARVLNHQITDAEPVEPLRYPKLRQLKSQIPTSSIGLRDFNAIKGCQANLLIAQRNTPLGRTHLPSIRYIYEVQLINALQSCQRQNAPAQTKLQSWLDEKTNNLPLVWADLVQISDEIKTAFSSNGAFLDQTNGQALRATHNALVFLLSLERGGNATLDNLEQHLKQLAQYKLPSKVWRSQRLLAKELNRTTLWLQSQSLAKQCLNEQPSQQISYLRNVFQLFFIEKIQPVASQLNHIQYQLLPLYQQFSHSPFLNQRFKNLLEEHHLQFTAYQDAMSQHITFWQELLARCNLSPMANPTAL